MALDDQDPGIKKSENKLLHGFSDFVQRHKMMAALLVLIPIYFVYGWFVGPNLNDSPTQTYEISGEFPFDQGLSLDLKVSYQSSNPTCRQMARVFFLIPAAEVDRRLSIHLPVKQVGPNRYATEVVLDRYRPGFCEWRYAGMGYRIVGGKQSSTAHDGLGPIPNRLKKLDMQCKYHEIIEQKRFYISCNGSNESLVETNTKPSAELNFFWEGK